jgi:hypothetical protein
MRWLMQLFVLLLSPVVKLAGVVLNQARALREHLQYRLEFKPRPDDIFIVTYPKSGTTWMQMLLVQLLWKDGAEFDHISQKSPYLEDALRYERLDFLDKVPSPRVIKTHMPYWMLRPSKDARIIFVTRDPRDTFVSCYHHYELVRRFRSSFDTFMSGIVRGRGSFMSWFQFMQGWLPHRNDANLLWVRYEDLSKDLEGQARRIAAFLKIPVPEERMPDILRNCSFESMRQQDHKFDVRTVIYEASPGGFIRQGGSGTKPALREEHVAELERNLARLRGSLGLRDTETF